MPSSCPTPERLAAAVRASQPCGDDADLATHLADCPACQAQLESLAGGSGWLEAKARTHATTRPTACESLRRVMHALESRSSDAAHEAPSPLKLDFLQPTDQAGVLGRFGPYEVVAHIASGGMGIVLKARDPALDRVVALKILQPALAANSLARARFVREARAAAAVVHEHVVPIYAVDEFAGLPYLVMQFVSGRSLADRLRASGALWLEEILRIGAQTAAGLGAAHGQGLIHRDVKPGNILLENSVERVKLTDFGLARAVDDTGLTRTGELAGTPEFMAPEQAGNETVDHRADLFSFGSVMYAMCTGVSPFQGTSIVAVIRQVCDKQLPPVHEVNQTIPRWLSDIIARLMAKAPDARFQSAQQVRELLERYLARVQHGDLSEMPLAQTSKSAVSRISKPADETLSHAAPIWKSAIQQVWKPALLLAVVTALFFTLKNRRAVSPNFSLSPPTQENRETKPSPSASIQEPFVVRTEEETNGFRVTRRLFFTRIEDALAAAPRGAVIELCWNGTRDIDPISLPPKPLTLRAGRGFQPVWNNSSGTASALSANAALTLEEIRF